MSATLEIQLRRYVLAVAATLALAIATLGTSPGEALAQAGDINPGGEPLVSVDNATAVNEELLGEEAPLADGSLDSTTEAVAPAVPVESQAGVEGDALIGDLVGEDACVQTGVNAPAGQCSPAAAPTEPVPAEPVPAEPVPGQPGSPAPGDSLVEGAVDGTAGAEAPLPAQTGVGVDAGAAVEPVADADICLNVGVNQAPAECQAANAEPLPEPVPDPPAADEGAPGAGSNETPLVDAGVESPVGVDAPLPVEGGLQNEVVADVGDVAGVDVCAPVGINQPPASCADNASGEGTPGTGTPDDGMNPDDGIAAPAPPLVDAGVESPVGVNAPLPVEGGLQNEVVAGVGDVAGVDVCAPVGVNQPPASCADGATGDGTPGSGTPGGSNPDNGMSPGDGSPGIQPPLVGGDVDTDVGADVPLPVDAGVGADTDATVDDLVGADICAEVGVNQDLSVCNQPTPPDDGMPGDGSPGDGSPGDGMNPGSENPGDGMSPGNGTNPDDGGPNDGINPGDGIEPGTVPGPGEGAPGDGTNPGNETAPDNGAPSPDEGTSDGTESVGSVPVSEEASDVGLPVGEAVSPTPGDGALGQSTPNEALIPLAPAPISGEVDAEPTELELSELSTSEEAANLPTKGTVSDTAGDAVDAPVGAAVDAADGSEKAASSTSDEVAVSDTGSGPNTGSSETSNSAEDSSVYPSNAPSLGEGGTLPDTGGPDLHTAAVALLAAICLLSGALLLMVSRRRCL